MRLHFKVYLCKVFKKIAFTTDALKFNSHLIFNYFCCGSVRVQIVYSANLFLLVTFSINFLGLMVFRYNDIQKTERYNVIV